MQEESELTPEMQSPEDVQERPSDSAEPVETVDAPPAGESISAQEPAQEPEPESAEDPEPEPESESAEEPEPEPEPESAEEPVPVAPVADAEVPQAEALSVPEAPRVPWWPFLLLIGLWAALAGAAAYLLTRLPDTPAYEQEYYSAIVIAGVVLTLLGPLIAGVTWAVIRGDAGAGDRGALFVTAFLRAAAMTLIGVLVWWGIIVGVDALRLGLVRF